MFIRNCEFVIVETGSYHIAHDELFKVYNRVRSKKPLVFSFAIFTGNYLVRIYFNKEL